MPTKAAEASRRWRERHPERAKAAQAKYRAKRPTLRYAALVAAAAEVTALWAAYAWHGTANRADVDDAVARLDALVAETGR